MLCATPYAQKGCHGAACQLFQLLPPFQFWLPQDFHALAQACVGALSYCSSGGDDRTHDDDDDDGGDDDHEHGLGDCEDVRKDSDDGCD